MFIRAAVEVVYKMELHKFIERDYVGKVIVWDGKLETISQLKSLYPNYLFAQDCEGDFLIVRSKTVSTEKYILDRNDAVLYDEYAKAFTFLAPASSLFSE